MMRSKTLLPYCLPSLCAVVSLGCNDHLAIPVESFRNGDIIFQTSKSRQSRAIQLATHSKYSHMGVLFQEGTGWSVYEAVGPVQNTPIDQWIARGEGEHYAVKR